MLSTNRIISIFIILVFCTALHDEGIAQQAAITDHPKEKKVAFGNKNIRLILDYNKQANISLLTVNGQQVIQGPAGIYASIKTKETEYSTLHLLSDPHIKVSANTLTVSNILYGDNSLSINETWTFTVKQNDVTFGLERSLSRAIIADQIALPAFMFNSITTWEGAYQDYGGLAWFYLFNKQLDTYGVHSSSSQFWNSKTGNGLTIDVNGQGNEVAMDYSRTKDDKLAYTIAVAKKELTPRFDSGTHRRRFLRDRNDVWASITMAAGKSRQSITLSYFNFNEKFGRGKFMGINGSQVSSVLNTIARIGVIDKQHFGGNSWHTPYGPICLHEQYIAQMGLAINDNTYLKGYQDCLNFYRDNAIKPDGRVWARWAYSNEDMMPGEVTDKGFYEAQWGYLLDSNPDYVTDVSELYDLTGDMAWVKGQQTACEKALDWIINRDSNGNGLVEMITKDHSQRRGSDWLDIIWASYENAFVNAKLYHALLLWSSIEKQLGNTAKENYYAAFAGKLKENFNKPVSAGGFWDEEKKCYIHWRDKDGSIHGNNMVTPVNFMAIAYGICDDDSRKKIILDAIETQMQKEKLFFWPVCMYTYNPGEANDWQLPFPNYENGDLFLSWGSIAVRAYASYKPELALKYVKNVLAQYEKDGLAFQRYGRVKQDGLGDDILSGNSLSVVGLYQAIYGINPLHNRFYLEPHITSELAGTKLNYNYQGQKLTIGLQLNKYEVSNGHFSITSKTNFGFSGSKDELQYFNGKSDTAALQVNTGGGDGLALTIESWDDQKMSWSQSSSAGTSQKLTYLVNTFTPGNSYTVKINGTTLKKVRSNQHGMITFSSEASNKLAQITVVKE